MPEIFIPKEVVPGFKLIMKLSKSQVAGINDYLKESNVSNDPTKFLNAFEDYISSHLEKEKSHEIVQTILSFDELITDEKDHTILANKLAESFKVSYEPAITSKDFNSLKNNLNDILASSVNLQLSLKAYRLTRENQNVYKKSKIISDIRIVFNEDINDKSRRAVLIHNLHIIYRSNKENKDFFATLDLDDLKELQVQVERAIKKDEIIKNDFKDLKLI